MSKQRVLRIIPVLDFGGVESLFLTQATHWSNEDIEIEYLTFWKDGHVANALRARGAKVHVLNIDPSIRNPRATIALYRFLRQYQPNLIHSVIGEANFHTMLCAPLGKWKVLIEEGGIPNRRLRNRLIHAGLYRFVDGIIAVSQASKTYIEEQEWAPKKRVHLISNAISENFFDITRSTPYRPHRIQFRAVGRLATVKNLDFLIRVFSEAMKKAPHIRLDIVGDGPLRNKLQAQIEALNTENIQLTGFCGDIVELHKNTDWLLVPSHSEGFGLVAAEAMAAGIHVISSNAGALPEVLGAMADDWTFEADAFEHWVERISLVSQYSAAEYKEISDVVKQHVGRFHPQHYVSALEELYLSMRAYT